MAQEGVLILASCNDKEHKKDYRLIEALKAYEEIDMASRTSVDFAQNHYCIAIDVKVKYSKKTSQIIRKIKKQPNITKAINFI